MIRNVSIHDARAIAEIYNYYIQHSTITFEEVPVSVGDMQHRISEVIAAFPWIVYETEGRVLGYAYANKWKLRASYKYSVESTIYVAPSAVGKKLGTGLYQELISRLNQLKYHAVIGGVALPNPASVRLHEKLGFQKMAHFHEVGYKFDRWIDVGYWELLLK